ncbi:hypothetical protein ACE1TI_17960 [Alteribacillus sp. JSM 102045]|uniref:hypothetical protein n=1 Tax=Alteribacillus sp. JSM 102045 TaxID=1562101 RepID=UPI0035C07CAF
MKKNVGFSLQPDVVKKIKTLVNRNQYSKNVRNFLHGQYTFPSNIEELAAFQHTKTSFDLLRLDKDTVLLLDEYVRRAKARGYNKANRSLIMRHVLAQFLKQLDEKSQESTKRIRRIPFYFQEGTSETLYHYISASDRNPMINQFILDEYKPSNDTNKLRTRPTKTERFTVALEEESIQRMDQFVEEIGVKGVTRTALMRDAVDQLIESLSTSTSNKIIVEQRLEASITEYKKVFGEKKLSEKLNKMSIVPEEDNIKVDKKIDIEEIKQSAQEELWWKLVQKFVFENHIDVRRSLVKDLIKTRPYDEKSKPKLLDDIFQDIGKGKKLRIYLLHGAFPFRGKRVSYNTKAPDIEEEIAKRVIDTVWEMRRSKP